MRISEILGRKKETAPPAARELTEQETKQIFYLSFRFSQAHIELQGNLLKMIHVLHPELQLPQDEQVKRKVIDHTVNMVRAMHKGGVHSDPKIDPVKEAEDQLTSMYDVFSTPPPTDLNELEGQIFRNLVWREFMYFNMPEGRGHTHPKADSWSSDFMRYVGRRKMPTTGNIYYDEVFEKVREYYKKGEWKGMENGRVRKEIDFIKKVYHRHHPNGFMRVLQKIRLKPSA